MSSFFRALTKYFSGKDGSAASPLENTAVIPVSLDYAFTLYWLSLREDFTVAVAC